MWAQRKQYGVAIPHGKGQSLGLSGPLKSIGNLCFGVCSKTCHLLLTNGMTAQLLKPTAML